MKDIAILGRPIHLQERSKAQMKGVTIEPIPVDENTSSLSAIIIDDEFYKFYDIATLNDGYRLEIRHNVHSYYNPVVHIQIS